MKKRKKRENKNKSVTFSHISCLGRIRTNVSKVLTEDCAYKKYGAHPRRILG